MCFFFKILSLQTTICCCFFCFVCFCFCFLPSLGKLICEAPDCVNDSAHYCNSGTKTKLYMCPEHHQVHSALCAGSDMHTNQFWDTIKVYSRMMKTITADDNRTIAQMRDLFPSEFFFSSVFVFYCFSCHHAHKLLTDLVLFGALWCSLVLFGDWCLLVIGAIWCFVFQRTHSVLQDQLRHEEGGGISLWHTLLVFDMLQTTPEQVSEKQLQLRELPHDCICYSCNEQFIRYDPSSEEKAETIATATTPTASTPIAPNNKSTVDCQPSTHPIPPTYHIVICRNESAVCISAMQCRRGC
jgi:hypothetical protein